MSDGMGWDGMGWDGMGWDGMGKAVGSVLLIQGSSLLSAKPSRPRSQQTRAVSEQGTEPRPSVCWSGRHS